MLIAVLAASPARAASAVLYVDQTQVPDFGSFWVSPHSELAMKVRYKNVGTTTWNNTGGVTNPNFMELRSVDGGCVIVNGAMYDGTWINPQRIHPFDGGGSIAPNAIATFSFTGKAPTVPGEYTLYQWVAPWGTTGCQAGWHGVNFWVRVDGAPPTAAQTGGPGPGVYRTDGNIMIGVGDTQSGVGGYLWAWDDPNVSAGTNSLIVPISSVPSQYGSHTLFFRTWDKTVKQSGGVVVQANNTQTYNLGQWTYAPNRPPLINCPGPQSVAEGVLISFPVSASDPDLDPVGVSAINLPAGSSFTGGMFTWRPGSSQSGDYNPTFTATDNSSLSSSCSVAIHVSNVDRAPVVSCPQTVSGAEGQPVTITVTASDPDNDAIGSLTLTGQPSGATFTSSAGNTIGTLTWTPGFADAGTFPLQFTAANGLAGSASCVLTISNVDRAPFVTAPATASGEAGTALAILVQASDPDGETLNSLLADVSALPAGNNASLTVSADKSTGTFRWIPALADTGTFDIGFAAVNALSGSAVTTVTITPSTLPAAPMLVAPLPNDHVSSAPTFLWETMAGAASYRLVVATDVAMQSTLWVTNVAGPDTSTAYNGPPLSPGFAYFWAVQSLGAAGWSPLAVPWRFYRDSGAPPLAAPGGLSPSNQAQAVLPALLSWDPVAGAAVYRVRLVFPGDGSVIWTGLSSVPSLTLPSVVPGIGPGSVVTWAVASVDQFGTEGSASSPASIEFADHQTPPGPVTLTAPAQGSTVTSQAISFTWQPPAGANMYALSYSLSPIFPATSDSTWTIGALTRSYAILQLPPGFATIYWNVTAQNVAGPGPTSPTGSFTFDVQRLDVTSVTMLRPIGHALVSKNATYIASAQVLGTWSGPISGKWRLDNADWLPFSLTMTAPHGVIFESPPLPTGQPGLHTIQCAVAAPAASVSSSGLYEVVDRQPGPPAALAAIVVPTSLEADGVSEATATMSILDSTGVLVASDTGRPITQTVSGPVTVVSTAGTTTNGQLVTVLQAGSIPGDAEISFTADGLVTVLPTHPNPTGDGASASIAYSGFQFPVEDYAKRIMQGFNVTNKKRPCGLSTSTIYKKHVAEDVGYAGAAGKLEVHAAGDGIVRYSREYGWCGGCVPRVASLISGGWGWIIIIEHDLPSGDPDGQKVCTIYGHVDPTSVVVQEGQSVKRGDLLAKVGSQPCAGWGEHVHFAVYRAGFRGMPQGSCDHIPYPQFTDFKSLTGYLCPAESPGSYLDPSKFVRTHLPTSVVVKVVIPVQNGIVTQKRAEANYYLGQLAAANQFYVTTGLKTVIDNPAMSAEALTRVALAEQAMLRIYHSERTKCTRYCEEPLDVPGASVLVDDMGRSLQSLLGVGAGSLNIVRQVESGTRKVLGIVIKPKSAEAIRKAKHAIVNTADRFVNSQVVKIHDADMRGRLQGVQHQILMRLNDDIDAGEPLADVLTGDLFTAAAKTLVLDADYVKAHTQKDLERVACLAGGPYGNAQADAVIQVHNQVASAAHTSASADLRYRQDNQCAEQEAKIAKHLDFIKNAMLVVGLDPLAGLAAFVEQVPKWLGIIAQAEGLASTAAEYPNMAHRVHDAVSFAFGTNAGCPGQVPNVAPQLALSSMPTPATRRVWSTLMATEATKSSSYEAIARLVILAIEGRDSLRCETLFDTLSTAGDVLDDAADLALSPYFAAGDEAVFRDAAHDSTVDALTQSASAGQMARAAFVLSVAAYLESPADSVVQQGARSAGNAAIFATSGAKVDLSKALPGVFDTPATPLLRMSAIRGPDSVTVGNVFTVSATCTNLGAGTSAGGLLRFQHDEGMEAVSPDSLALPPLAPGDSTTISWLVRPTAVLNFDTTGVAETAISLLTSCSNGLGEQRQVPLTVYQVIPTDGVPSPPVHPLTLQMGITPNPSTHGTEIWCTLPKSARVTVEIFDVAGRRVSTLFRGISPAGRMALRWNGELANGARAAGGIYFAQVRVDQKTLTRRLVWLQ